MTKKIYQNIEITSSEDKKSGVALKNLKNAQVLATDDDGNIIATDKVGGIGDVTLAGNQTFTGENTFNKIPLAPNPQGNNENELTKKAYVDEKLDTKINKSEKDASNGVAILDANGVLPSKYLPPSDVLVYWEKSNFPAQGDTKKIYFEQSTRKMYVYNGSAGYKEYTEHIGRTKSLANRTDLNDILEDGWFVSETNVKSATLRNAPIQRAFTLISYKSAGFIQEVIDYDLQSRWIRRYYGFLNNWSAWQEVPIKKEEPSVDFRNKVPTLRDVQYFDPQSNKINSFFSPRDIGHIHLFNDQADNEKSIIFGFNSKNRFEFFALDEENINT